MLVIATFELHVRSRQLPKCDHTVFHLYHLEKIKHLKCAQEYTVTVLNQFEVLDTLEDSAELRNTFKRETLEVAKECIERHSRSPSGFALVDAGKD